jgi:hypothetical protein
VLESGSWSCVLVSSPSHHEEHDGTADHRRRNGFNDGPRSGGPLCLGHDDSDESDGHRGVDRPRATLRPRGPQQHPAACEQQCKQERRTTRHDQRNQQVEDEVSRPGISRQLTACRNVSEDPDEVCTTSNSQAYRSTQRGLHIQPRPHHSAPLTDWSVHDHLSAPNETGLNLGLRSRLYFLVMSKRSQGLDYSVPVSRLVTPPMMMPWRSRRS